MYAAGMELGSHLTYHLWPRSPANTLASWMTSNISGVALATESESDVATLVWPCGVRNVEAGVVAAKYYQSARGYNSNQLEDKTPFDFMNLKSFNSRQGMPRIRQQLAHDRGRRHRSGQMGKLGSARHHER